MFSKLGKGFVLALLVVAACSGRASCFGRASQTSDSTVDAAPDAGLVLPDAAPAPALDAAPLTPPADGGGWDCPDSGV